MTDPVLLMVTRVTPDGSEEAEPVAVWVDARGNAEIVLDDGEMLAMDGPTAAAMSAALAPRVRRGRVAA